MPIRGVNGGNAGQGSKWISRKTRHRIYSRDGWKCVWCGTVVAVRVGPTKWSTGVTAAEAESAGASDDWCGATLDHVIPRSAGGANIPANLITCCMKCNRERGEEMPERFALYNCKGPEWSTLARVLRAVCRPLPPAP